MADLVEAEGLDGVKDFLDWDCSWDLVNAGEGAIDCLAESALASIQSVESLAGASGCGLDPSAGSEGLSDGVERGCASSEVERLFGKRVTSALPASRFGSGVDGGVPGKAL